MLPSDKEILSKIVSLAIDAGTAIMEVYKSDDFGETLKSDNSPLTKADIAANNVIVAGLKSLTPDLPILSEECKQTEYEERRGWDRYWLVDPLDGTKEFIKRNGQFTVNIALIENGSPILGVVHAPVFGSTYFASKDHGAFKQMGNEAPAKIRVSDYREGKLKVVASISHITPELEKFLSEIGPHERTAMGSSLKLCLVAEGVAHIYPRLGPTMEWDTAAAHCVVEGAGGTVTDTGGNPLKYNKENLLNPYFIVCGAPPFPWRKQ